MSTQTEGNIYRKIILLMMNSKRHLARATEKYEMTVAQGMLLMLFEPNKGISMQTLSCMMGCDASNVTGLVERLDTQGIIKRTSDPGDRRVKLIELSSKGVERRATILEDLEVSQAANIQKLTSVEQAEFIRLIDKFTAKEKSDAKVHIK